MAGRVTVFGGSQPARGDSAYSEALELGKLLGQAGFTVLTGGYIGTMEAISRGAAEAGAHVIGVTCEEIERWRAVKPNDWMAEEWRCKTLHERLDRLIRGCDAAIALPGGPGTLTEIALMWNLLLTNSIPPKPLILISQGWKEVFSVFYRELGVYIPEHQRRWLSFVPNYETAMAELQSKIVTAHQPAAAG